MHGGILGPVREDTLGHGAVGLGHDLLEHGEVDLVEVGDVQADQTGLVRAEPGEGIRVRADPVGQVDRGRRLAG